MPGSYGCRDVTVREPWSKELISEGSAGNKASRWQGGWGMALEKLVREGFSEEVSLELREDRGRFVKKPCR